MANLLVTDRVTALLTEWLIECLPDSVVLDWLFDCLTDLLTDWGVSGLLTGALPADWLVD